jgi:hypothetical protein
MFSCPAECGGEATLLHAELDWSIPREYFHSDMDICDWRRMGWLGERHQLRPAN